MAQTVNWLTHEFNVHQHGDSWNEVAGLYIFAGLNSAGQWYPLYVGQADSLAARLPNHERWQEALQLGATHVHAKCEKTTAARDAVEQQLIQRFQPQLNVHHR